MRDRFCQCLNLGLRGLPVLAGFKRQFFQKCKRVSKPSLHLDCFPPFKYLSAAIREAFACLTFDTVLRILQPILTSSKMVRAWAHGMSQVNCPSHTHCPTKGVKELQGV